LGANFDGTTYYYFDQENRQILNLTFDEIKELSDAEINFLTENLEASHQLEEQRKKKEEDDRIAEGNRKREEQKAEDLRLENERKLLEEQQKEQDRIKEQNRKAAEKLEEQRKEMEAAIFETRSAKLMAAGFELIQDRLYFKNRSGSSFVLRETVISHTKEEWIGEESVLLNEVEKLKKAEADLLADEKQKEIQKQLEAQQKENDRKAAEKELSRRTGLLEAVGFEKESTMYRVGDVVKADLVDISQLSEAEFDGFLTAGKMELQRLANKKIEDDRIAEDNRIKEELQRIEEDNRRIQEENKRKAELAPDKEKLIALAALIGTILVPEVKTAKAKQIANGAREMLQKANAWITEQTGKMR